MAAEEQAEMTDSAQVGPKMIPSPPMSGFILPDPQPTEADWELRNLINAALLFSLDEYYPESGEEIDERTEDPHDVLLAKCERYFYDRFFEPVGVFVARKALINRLVVTSKRTRYSVLQGPRGSGKSTTMRRLCSDLGGDDGTLDLMILDPEAAARSVIYVDLKRYEDILLDKTLGDHRVCEVIYERLCSRFFGGVNRDRLKKSAARRATKTGLAWEEFRLRSGKKSYRKVATRTNRTWTEKDGDVVVHTRTHHAKHLDRAHTQFEKEPSQARLTLLLSFLKKRYRHSVLILLDNVDRYGDLLHTELNETARALASSPDSGGRFIVAMRTSTAARVFAGDDEKKDVANVTVDIETHERELLDSLSDAALWNEFGDFVFEEGSDRESLPVGDRFFIGIVVKRLVLLAKFLDDLAEDASQEHLRKQLSVIRRQAVQVLRSRHDEHVHLEFRRTLLRWHNYSIRSALAHQFRVYSTMITGYDVLLPSPLASAVSDADVPSAHDFRTLLWRHIIFGDSPGLKQPRSIVPNMIEETCVGTIEVFGPRLKLLQILARRGETTLGVVRGDLVRIGVTKDEVDEFLELLLVGRGFETEGLISVDGHVRSLRRTRLVSDLADERTAKIRPAGRFFLQWIAPSCEYLFWCAMHSTDRGLAQAVANLADPLEWDYQLLARDDFRASVAVAYLEGVVYRNEMLQLTDPPGNEVQALHWHRTAIVQRTRIKEWRNGWSYLHRSCAGLEGFIASSPEDQMPQSTKEELRSRVKALRVKYERACRSAGVSVP